MVKLLAAGLVGAVLPSVHADFIAAKLVSLGLSTQLVSPEMAAWLIQSLLIYLVGNVAWDIVVALKEDLQEFQGFKRGLLDTANVRATAAGIAAQQGDMYLEQGRQKCHEAKVALEESKDAIKKYNAIRWRPFSWKRRTRCGFYRHSF
jgi:hypothetical protein